MPRVTPTGAARGTGPAPTPTGATEIELYKLAVEMADRISARRALAQHILSNCEYSPAALQSGKELRWYGGGEHYVADRLLPAGGATGAVTAASGPRRAGFRTVGSVATGRAAPHEPTPPSNHVMPDAEREPGTTGAATRRRALARAAERQALKAAQRESERATARLTRVARAAGVPEHRSLWLREILRPGERPTAAGMCSLKGESVDDTLLVATTQRVIWSRGTGGHSAVEAGELAAVSGDQDLTLEFRGRRSKQFSSWRIDHLHRLASAVQTLIDERAE